MNFARCEKCNLSPLGNVIAICFLVVSQLFIGRFTFTIDLVLSEKVSFPTCTHVTAISIQAHLMASSIIDFTSVDVCRTKEEITLSTEVQDTLMISCS